MHHPSALPLCVQLYLHTAHCEFKILNIQLGKLPPFPPPGPHTQSSDILYLCVQAMLNLTGDGIYSAYIYSTHAVRTQGAGIIMEDRPYTASCLA